MAESAVMTALFNIKYNFEQTETKQWPFQVTWACILSGHDDWIQTRVYDSRRQQQDWLVWLFCRVTNRMLHLDPLSRTFCLITREQAWRKMGRGFGAVKKQSAIAVARSRPIVPTVSPRKGDLRSDQQWNSKAERIRVPRPHGSSMQPVPKTFSWPLGTCALYKSSLGKYVSGNLLGGQRRPSGNGSMGSIARWNL